jgi:hypothetical protein
MRGVPRERRAISKPPSLVELRFEQTAAAHDDALQLLGAVELQARHDAKAVAQRIGQHAGTGGGAHQGERLQIELDAACGRAFANHDVDLVVLQRGIQNFFDHG